jgi:hypothetical protein
MSQGPSIKGILLAIDVEDVHKRIAAGDVTRAELARRLPPKALAVLDGPLHTGLWYDIEIANALLALLGDLAGDRVAFLLARGAGAAQKLFDSGLYQQMEYVKRMQVKAESDPAARAAAYGRDLRLTTTLSASTFNFTQWVVRPDPDHACRFCVEVAGAAQLPDAHCWTTQGFMNWIAGQAGRPELWRWTRPAPDRVVFRMTSDV